MSDLRDLYQEVILDHGKHPRNFGSLDDATAHADGHNPLCGDTLTVYVRLEDDRLVEVRFQGSGCAICMSSASLMTQAVQGRSVGDSRELFRHFHDLVTGQSGGGDEAELGKLVVFSGVREFPVRVKCATLPWHTLEAALKNQQEPVSTE
jgi:nitrogen fixation NifU-like protein